MQRRASAGDHDPGSFCCSPGSGDRRRRLRQHRVDVIRLPDSPNPKALWGESPPSAPKSSYDALLTIEFIRFGYRAEQTISSYFAEVCVVARLFETRRNTTVYRSVHGAGCREVDGRGVKQVKRRKGFHQASEIAQNPELALADLRRIIDDTGESILASLGLVQPD